MIPDFSPGRPDRPPSRDLRWPGLALLVCAVLALAGCKDEAIKHYTVPHEEPPEVVSSPHGGMRPGGPMMAKEDRIVAGFVPIGNGACRFFKMSGKRALVERAKPAFVQFLEKSVDLQKSPDQWVGLPEGWKFDPAPREMREATFVISDPHLEVALSTASGTDLENLNRWRGQVGLPPVKEDLAREIQPQKIGGQDGKLVDVSRPRDETVPENWEKVTSPLAEIRAKYQIQGTQAFVSVTELKAPQDLVQNVNRWCDEVGHEHFTSDNVQQAVTTLDIGTIKGKYVDLSNPQGDARTRKRLLGVLVERGPMVWVFVLRGPDQPVAEHKKAFETFVKAYKFPPIEGDR